MVDTRVDCNRAPFGWYCTRFPGHTGPCALIARWWNLPEWVRYCRNEFWR